MSPPHFPRLSRRQDPIVVRARDAAKGAGPDDAVLLDGMKLVLDALDAGVTVDVILATADVLQDGSADVRTLTRVAAAAGAVVYEASPGVIDAASPARTPSGVVAIARWSPSPLSGVWKPAPALAIGLIDVQDPGNAGAVVRAADGLGATGVVMAGATAAPGSAKALRGAMGSTFRVPVARGSAADTLRAARAAGVRIAATMAPSSETRDIHDVDLTAPMLILLGNEGAGLPEPVLSAADVRMHVPMRQGVNSLNVAVTSALVLYEARLQRGAR